MATEQAAVQDEESNRPGPGEPACRECGDLAEHPVEFPQYCQMCWNGNLRRRLARREHFLLDTSVLL